MKILIACEFSQVVTKAFRDKGHEAYSCDIIPCEGGHPEWHILGDVRTCLSGNWDMMIAHPPCTYLSNSGVRWLKDNKERERAMWTATSFFNTLLLYPDIPKIAVENPIQHKYARQLIRKYDQVIQPHWFIGSNESKATCLWLKGLPNLKRTQWLDKKDIKHSIHRMPPSETRGHDRSVCPESIARAMAEQWG